MDVLTSPQHSAVGEEDQFPQGQNRSFVSMFKEQKEGEKKLDLCPISIEQGIPTVEFTVDEVNSFTREEGLHQAVIFKFSYGKPEIQELRRIFPKRFDVKGKCNIGQLEFRHILVRLDLYEDFANVVSRSSGFVKSKGEEFFFRTFPWTMGFNPREETPKAVIWMSLPDLPANLFAKKSLLSIASMVGKPIAIDKATQDRTRPSTARVKILVNLLDNLPKKSKIKIIDEKSGNIIEYEQRFVFDNLPKYCTFCHHQGHDVSSCRRISNDLSGQAGAQSMISVEKLKGDARVLLDAKIARRRTEESPQEDNSHNSELVSSKENKNQNVNPVDAQFKTMKIDLAQHGKPPVRSNPKEQKVWKAVAQQMDGVPKVPNVLTPDVVSAQEGKGKDVVVQTTDANDDVSAEKQQYFNSITTDQGLQVIEVQAEEKQGSELEEQLLCNDAESPVDAICKSSSVMTGNSNQALGNLNVDSLNDLQLNLNAHGEMQSDMNQSKIKAHSELLMPKSSLKAAEFVTQEANVQPISTVSLPYGIKDIQTSKRNEMVPEQHLNDVKITEEGIELLSNVQIDFESKLQPHSEQIPIFKSAAAEVLHQKGSMQQNDNALFKHPDIEQISFSAASTDVQPIRIEASQSEIMQSVITVASAELNLNQSIRTDPIQHQQIHNASVVQMMDRPCEEFQGESSMRKKNAASPQPKSVSKIEENKVSLSVSNSIDVVESAGILSADCDQIATNGQTLNDFVQQNLVSPDSPVDNLFEQEARIIVDRTSIRVAPNSKDLDGHNMQIADPKDQQSSSPSIDSSHDNSRGSTEPSSHPVKKSAVAQMEINSKAEEVKQKEVNMKPTDQCNVSHKQIAILDAINDASVNEKIADNCQSSNWQDTVHSSNMKDHEPKLLIKEAQAMQQVVSTHPTISPANSVVNDSSRLVKEDGQHPVCPIPTHAAECLTQNRDALSQSKLVAKTTAHKSATNSKRSKGTKLKTWNDQRDYDDEETWGEGLASFSWEEEDQEEEDSDDSVDQICQIKDAKKNIRANVNQSASPKSSLNHNAPLFVPKNEDVLTRKLPMRHAKLKQTLQPLVLKPSRQRNKREL